MRTYNTILVTGGAGFIGSNMVRYLLIGNSGFTGRIINVDALFRSYDVDAIIHFAAESHVDRSILGSEAFVTTNVLGNRNFVLGTKIKAKDFSSKKIN